MEQTNNTAKYIVPKERKNRARRASVLICAITASFTVIFCFLTGNVDEYNLSQKNTTNICYSKTTKLRLPALFTTLLGLCSVVFGTVVDRLSLVVEERYHLQERYDGSKKKMIKACFSGISRGPVILLIIVTFLSAITMIALTEMPWFELRYLVYILSGIGVGPLVMHLLNLNTHSEIVISRILEEKRMYVSNVLAWSFYFNQLQEGVQKFKDEIRLNNDNETKEFSISNKLILLIPHDCHMEKNLQMIDSTNIKYKRHLNTSQEPYKLPVYRLTVNENEDQHEYFVIKYVREPLKTLSEMRTLKHEKAVEKQNCGDEVSLLYKSLSDILEKPPKPECNLETCILVFINVKKENLGNGVLVKCIMKQVNHSSTQLLQIDGASTSGISSNSKKPREHGERSFAGLSKQEAAKDTEGEAMIRKNSKEVDDRNSSSVSTSSKGSRLSMVGKNESEF